MIRRAFLPVLLALASPAAAQPQTPPSPAPPSATPIVDALKSLCVATSADKAAALTAADAAGWGPIPDAFLAQAGGVMQEPAGRLKADATGIQILVTGEQSQAMGAQTLRIKACAVVAAVPEPAPVEAAAAALAGVGKAPIPNLGEGASLWAYDDKPTGHVLLNPDDKAAVSAAVTAGTARLVFFRPLDVPGAPPGLALLGYGVPRN